MLRLVTLLLIYLGVSRVDAMEFETYFYKAFARAKTSEQVANLTKDYERWRVTHAACLIELRDRTLPSSCYEELQWSKISGQKRAEAIIRLDRICLQATRRLSIRLYVHPALSRACAKEVRDAIAVQAYRREDADGRWSEN